MTTILFSDFKDGNTTKNSIYVKGHSGYGVKGGDLVCAGISTLVFGFIENLDKANLEYDCNMEEDSVLIMYDSVISPRYSFYEDFLYNALKMMEREFPEYVKVM